MFGRGPRSRAAVVGSTTALALLAPLGVTSLAGTSVAGAATAEARGSRAPAAAVGPKLSWGPCPDDEFHASPEAEGPTFDCAVAEVPLDHDVPGGPTVDLALKRRKADLPEQRIGSMFVNPGGPGGSGVDLVSFADFVYAPEVLGRFDIIGFDPRGVARSAPLTCFDSVEDFFEFYRFLPTFPVTRREERETAAAYAGYTARCAERDDPLLEHMSTADVARDLDLLRAAVGDERLTYAGYSYGSQLGTTYANLFPSRVRALVLDGVLDPVAWTTGVRRPRGGSPADVARRSALPVSTRLRSPQGAHAALQQFFALCQQAGPEVCKLAEGGARQRFDRLAVRALAEPIDIPMGGGQFQRVGYAELVAIALGSMYDAMSWHFFADFVAEVERFGERGRVGEAYRRLAAQLAVSALDEEPEQPEQQTIEGFTGVLCSDSDNPRDERAWSRAALEADLRAPYFGRPWTWGSIACATWPAPAVADRYAGPWNARTAKPVLLVGNRYDPATPYSGAQVVAGLLPSSRLLTLEGYGHVSLGQSSCIDEHVSAYLLEGTLPPRGATCRPDVVPFAPLPEVSTSSADAATEEGRQAARREILRHLPSLR